MTKREGREILRRFKRLGIRVAMLSEKWDVSRWAIYAVLSNHATSRNLEEKLRELGGKDEPEGC